MLVKCICTNCAGHLEFEEENAGQKIKCPLCGFDTVLFLPGHEPTEDGDGTAGRFRLGRRALLGAVAGLLVLAGICWAAYQWAVPFVKDLLSIESTVGTVLLLVLGCLLVPLVLAWLVLPMVVFLELRKLNGLLSQIEINLRPEVVESPEVEPEPEPEVEPEPILVEEDARKL